MATSATVNDYERLPTTLSFYLCYMETNKIPLATTNDWQWVSLDPKVAIKLDPKNTVKNIKHLRIQHLFNNPKRYSSCDQYPKKVTNFRNSDPKKILRWSLSVNMTSPTPGNLNERLWKTVNGHKRPSTTLKDRQRHGSDSQRSRNSNDRERSSTAFSNR